MHSGWRSAALLALVSRSRAMPARGRRSEGNPAPRPARKGALFRALVEAGCDLDAAYNAETEFRSMATENLVAQLGAQIQVGFMEVKQICRENAERLAEQGRKLDALAEAGARRDRKIEALATEAKVPGREVDAIGTDLKTIHTDLKAVAEDVKAIVVEVRGLKEALTARTDTHRRELQFIQSALVLLTVLVAVFALLFTR